MIAFHSVKTENMIATMFATRIHAQIDARLQWVGREKTTTKKPREWSNDLSAEINSISFRSTQRNAHTRFRTQHNFFASSQMKTFKTPILFMMHTSMIELVIKYWLCLCLLLYHRIRKLVVLVENDRYAWIVHCEQRFRESENKRGNLIPSCSIS